MLRQVPKADCVTAPAVAAVRARPEFPAAVCASLTETVKAYDGNRLLNQLMNDRARALFSHAALYLHFGGGTGLTVTRLKDLCTELKLCSNGRVEVMLALMRASGYLALAPSDGDGRVRRLVPSEKLISLHRERWRFQFKACAPLLDSAARAITALDDPEFIAALARQLGDQALSGIRPIDFAPEIEGYIDRKAGFVILYSLVLAGGELGAPPREPVAMSVSSLSRKFLVSRKHVLTLLRDAEADGLLKRLDDGEKLLLTPKLFDGVSKFVAAMFLLLGEAAGAALQETARIRSGSMP